MGLNCLFYSKYETWGGWVQVGVRGKGGDNLGLGLLKMGLFDSAFSLCCMYVHNVGRMGSGVGLLLQFTPYMIQ